MNKKGKDIADELVEIVPGLNLPADAPFTAPEGYFNALPEQIMQRIRAANADAEPVQEELAALSSLLAAAPRPQPQSVPSGYFEKLPERVMAAIAEERAIPAKVVPLRNTRRRYMAWIAAASVAAILTGVLFMFKGTSHNASSLEAQLAGIPDQEIVDYLQTHTDAFDNEAIFSNVSTEEVADELPSMSTDLSTLPTEAIQKYLESSGWQN
ncbi:MAG TPA: hypothetical protein VIM87_03075 [Chitinophaga sp.]|uniref:hypothetical protein n=1 Tax=Chitinophaga sp. TaxID=1869181 RepID=UPI002F943728